MPRVTRIQDLTLVFLSLASMIPVTVAELTSDLLYQWQAFAFLGGAAMCGVIGVLAPRRRPIGPWRQILVRLIVLGAVVYALIEAFRYGQVPVIALGHFSIALCAAKFLELRELRDRTILVVISLLLMVIGAMVSANVAFGAVLVIYMTVGVHWLARFRLTAEAAAVAARTLKGLAASATGPAAAAVPPSTTPRLFVLALAYGGVLAMVVVVMFLLVPRNVFSASFQLHVPPSMSGFTSHVGLDDIAPLLESEQPFMRVRARRNGVTIEDVEELPYLRRLTFEHYAGDGRWTLNTGRSSPTVYMGDRNDLRALWQSFEPAAPRAIELEFWIDHLSNVDHLNNFDLYLFSGYPALQAASPDVGEIDFYPHDCTLKLRRPPEGKLNYRVFLPESSGPQLYQRMTAEAQAVAERAKRGDHDNVVRQISPRRSQKKEEPVMPPAVAALARQIAGVPQGNADPSSVERIAGAFVEHLQSDRFTYSLDPRDQHNPRTRRNEPRTDPVERFLTQTRRGYCKQFASAMALMCQAVGIKARLVSGFAGGEYNAVGGFFRVRNKDAHAWVEVLVPDHGWLTYDPTPGRAVDSQTDSATWAALLGRWYDFFQFAWSGFVVSFDSAHRHQIVATFQRWWEQLTRRGPGAHGWLAVLQKILYGPPELGAEVRFLWWLAVALIVALAVLVIRALWIVSLIVREHLPRPRKERAVMQRRPGTGFYDRLLILLARQGHRKPLSLTPREFAHDLSGRNRDLAPVVDLTEWFYGVQYGHQPLPRERRKLVSELLFNLREYGRFDPDSNKTP